MLSNSLGSLPRVTILHDLFYLLLDGSNVLVFLESEGTNDF